MLTIARYRGKPLLGTVARTCWKRPAPAALFSSGLDVWPSPDGLAQPDQPLEEKILEVAVAGLPNAGKSTLLNVLVADTVSAVSPKRNTTRETVLGVMTRGAVQVCFHDTPGYLSHTESRGYASTLYTAACEAIAEVDLTLVVVDAARKLDGRAKANLSSLLERSLLGNPKQLALVLNKVDLVNPKTRLLDKTEQLLEVVEGVTQKLAEQTQQQAEEREVGRCEERSPQGPGLGKRRGKGSSGNEGPDSPETGMGAEVPVFMISALRRDGVDDLASFLLARAEPGPWSFEEGERTDLDTRERVSELIRGSLYAFLHKELPYSVEQRTRHVGLTEGGEVSIEHDLLVATASQRFIILGKLGHIRRAAERDLRGLFKRPVRVWFTVRERKKG